MDEEEFVQNVADALCAVLLVAESQAAFVRAEGIELMLILLKCVSGRAVSSLFPKWLTCRRRANFISPLSVKILDFALNGNTYATSVFLLLAHWLTCVQRGVCAVCAGARAEDRLRRVHGQGLGCGRAGEEAQAGRSQPGGCGHARRSSRCPHVSRAAEHVVSLVCHLLQQLTGNDHLRVMNKFVENDFEKVDRVLELYVKYSRRMRVRLQFTLCRPVSLIGRRRAGGGEAPGCGRRGRRHRRRAVRPAVVVGGPC
jgi:beta-catenin-like protein 1